MVSPHDPYEQSELQGLLEASIGDLTRRQQAALLLKDVHGLSLVEVAACLELTPGSVEVLLARARRAFRASFEERCVAAGRPLPRSAGGLAALPLLPLPPGLAAPVVPFAPTAPHLPAPVFGPPLTLAAGSGIGAALGLPASLKTAVLIAAAAATVGTAEIAVTQRRPPAVAALRGVVAAAGARRDHVRSRGRHAGRAAPPTPARRADSVARRLSVGEPPPSPSPTEVAEPSPRRARSAIATPSATPEPSTRHPDAAPTTPTTSAVAVSLAVADATPGPSERLPAPSSSPAP